MRTHGVVAFAFGLPDTLASNERIADAAVAASLRLGYAPVFTQTGITIRSSQMNVTYVSEQTPGSPTLRIARAALSWAHDRDISCLTFVAAAPHAWRCRRDMQIANREHGGTLVLAEETICGYPYARWFSPEAAQARARSRMMWEIREWPLRIMPEWIYKKVAS